MQLGGVLWFLSLDCDSEDNSSPLCVLPFPLHGDQQFAFYLGKDCESKLCHADKRKCYQVVLAELWKNSYMVKAKDDHATAI